MELAGVSGVIQQIMEYAESGSGVGQGAQDPIFSMTTIVQVTTNPTAITVVNTTGATRSINNASLTVTGGPAATMTIIQLK